MLLPIGYVYGQLVRAIPDAAGEAAYTARFLSPRVSFATGWMMFLSYFLTSRSKRWPRDESPVTSSLP